jgi:hypothetical protein
MAVQDYITVDYLKAALRRTNDTFDDLFQAAISAASRQIDDHCNDQFWTDITAGPTVRVFEAVRPRDLATPSFSTTDGLVVELDVDGDGTFETTVPVGDVQAVPVTPKFGWPHQRIQLVGSQTFPGTTWSYYGGYGYGYGSYPGYYLPSYGGEWFPRSTRARVRVTAQWGWPAVPAQVVQACQILAISYYKTKDLTGGQAGTSGLSTGTFGGQKTVMLSGGAMDPEAAHLLCGLREPVVA